MTANAPYGSRLYVQIFTVSRLFADLSTYINCFSYLTVCYVCLSVEPSAERSGARVLCACDTAAICRRWQATTLSVLHHSVGVGGGAAGAGTARGAVVGALMSF